MRTFRACWSSYRVMTICVGIIPAITTPFALRGDKGAAQIAVLGWAALLFVYFWLLRFRLEFSDERVGYRSLFRPYRSVQRDAVVEADFAKKTSTYESPFTFIVRPAAGGELRINAKVFSREALQHLRELAPQGSNQSLQPTTDRRV